MARDDTYSNGLPIDQKSGQPIGQVLNYTLTSGNQVVPVSASNPLSVSQIDTHPGAVMNRFMHRHTAVTTTLTAATTGDGTENTIQVASVVGFSVNNYVHINTGTTEITHPKILDITGTTITLDRYIDYAHSIGDEVIQAVIDIASVTASLASPVTYYVAPPSDQVWHIARLIFEMRHDAAGDLSKFGGITALTNGCILRAKINGQYATLTNWKTNGDIKADMFDVEFDDRAGGGGIYATSGRGTFARVGAWPRLDGSTGDQIELIIQDNLTTLTGFTMKVQGHVEGA